MKELPILFSAPMVRAILDGHKTQTRRVVKQQPLSASAGLYCDRYNQSKQWAYWLPDNRMGAPRTFACPFGSPGDRLWVRETWQAWQQTNVEHDEWEPLTRESRMVSWAEWVDTNGPPDRIEYRADNKSVGPWTPAIHMPRWASRIDLEVMGVRVERLQDISEGDAKAEGVEANIDDGVIYFGPLGRGHFDPRVAFRWLWESINGADSWGANPWVWVIEFKRVRP